ncbi:hypothetical protein HMJ29_11655 [Hymenobacter taeanensis]|uniref:Glycosyl transferase n=1 Tax=Hymenobacter taeanensis TaxID=2735321 RepID=A0A6M6BHN9_9BACT|nr:MULTISPECIES: hypothetical protein [Hymenobacter]QJX47559.1 hypothetical protein HMJ29_11655 [Hymenobacter taeanensis]UOQ82957.1 hypothetical protein MUN83_09430 [Hymenobacter sp. 5414T-23]
MSELIKVGFNVAYDWEFLKTSLPIVYSSADKICLSIDKDRIGWSGKKYAFNDDEFYKFVKELDVDGKIDIYEDDFHITQLSPIDNDTRQRRLMSERMGDGGWFVQLDADEYFIDFEGFAKRLRNTKYSYPVNINCALVILYKRLGSGFLVIDNGGYSKAEKFPVATNVPAYKYARISDWFNIQYPFYILHQSWARSEEEIQQKVSNWGHKLDFDTNEYTNFWKGLDQENYKNVKNFHPIQPAVWSKLELVPAQGLESLVEYYKEKKLEVPNAFQQFFMNSLWISRLKSLLK